MFVEFTSYGPTPRPVRVLAAEVEAYAEAEWGCTLYLKSGNSISVKECCAEVCEKLGTPPMTKK